MFVLLCAYLASQVYTLPVLPFGPWAMWPTLPDVVFVGLVLAWIVSPSLQEPLTGARRNILVAFTILTGIVCTSYVVSTLLIFNLNAEVFGSNKGVGFGFYECARMVQYLILVRIAVSVPMPGSRQVILGRVAVATAWVVCLTCILTYTEVVTTAMLAPHIANDKVISGAWWHYVNNHNHYALGAISYTHAAVAVHVILLVGFAVHLRGEGPWISNLALLSAGLIATLLSGSRAGFAAMVLVVGVCLLARSPRWLTTAALTGVTLVLAGLVVVSSLQPQPGDAQSPLMSIIDRQSAALNPLSSENLVGRDQIWKGFVDTLNDQPGRWLVGSGFGSSPDMGPALSPHMMPLQIIVELGLWVLVVVSGWFVWLLVQFWRAGGTTRVMFWTTVGLLLSSATQETFYPVPSTGVFLGAFLLASIVVLQPVWVREENTATAPAEELDAGSPALQAA